MRKRSKRFLGEKAKVAAQLLSVARCRCCGIKWCAGARQKHQIVPVRFGQFRAQDGAYLPPQGVAQHRTHGTFARQNKTQPQHALIVGQHNQTQPAMADAQPGTTQYPIELGLAA